MLKASWVEESLVKEGKNTEKELVKFEQEWKREIAEIAEIDKAVEELTKLEIKQREKEGDEDGLEELSNYWLRFKIYQVEKEGKAEKFNECQISYGESVIVSKETEKEKELAQQEPHVEVNKEKPSSQANTELIMEADVDESISPETDSGNTLKNPNHTVPPHDFTPHEEPCDWTTKKPDTTVGSVA